MLNVAEIADPTGDIYIPGQGNHITDLVTCRVIEPDGCQFISDETGKVSRQLIRERPDQIRDMLPYRLLAATTGADISECQVFLIIIGTEVASHNSITNASFFVNETAQIRKKFSRSASLHFSQESGFSREQHEIANLASRLRELSGLDVESLAHVFNVSRATYHRWLRGLSLSKRHRESILEILPLLEETRQRLGSSEAVSTWLLTPASSGGKKPIEYLAEKRYDLFRGFLLHQRTGKEQFRPLQPSRRTFKPRKREEVEDVREQLRPHTWYDEENNPNNSNE